MDIKKTLIASAAVLTLVGSVTGVAVASSKGAVAPKSATETTTGADTDNIQQGDQTTPDTAGASESTGESSGESSSETGPSDGPGGHADPAGNVDHQFDGQE